MHLKVFSQSYIGMSFESTLYGIEHTNTINVTAGSIFSIKSRHVSNDMNNGYTATLYTNDQISS